MPHILSHYPFRAFSVHFCQEKTWDENPPCTKVRPSLMKSWAAETAFAATFRVNLLPSGHPTLLRTSHVLVPLFIIISLDLSLLEIPDFVPLYKTVLDFEITEAAHTNINEFNLGLNQY